MRKFSTYWGGMLVCLLSQLSPELFAQPINDLVCNNITLPQGVTINSGNGGATNTGSPAIPTGTCWSDGNAAGTLPATVVHNDVWFSFIAPAGVGGTIRITTATLGAGGMTDSQIQVWRAVPADSCTGTLVTVTGGCNDDISGSNFMSQVNLLQSDLLAGQRYFVQVDGWLGDTGAFTITYQYFPPAPQLNYPAPIAQNLLTSYTDLGTAGSVITVANNDNATSAAQSIGFNFTFGNATFTQFRLNTNGFIKLGTAAPSTDTLYRRFATSLTTTANEIGGAILRNTLGDTAIIAVLNTDLTDGTQGPAEFRVQTQGTAPNRVCVIQFKNMRDKPGVAAGQDAAYPLGAVMPSFWENVSFQIKLYESSNRIELVYNTFAMVTPAPTGNPLRTMEVGIKGANNSSDQVRFVQKLSASAWGTSVFVTSSTQNIFNYRPTGGFPDAPGRTFRFNQIRQNDGGVLRIMTLGNAPRPAGMPVTTQSVVTNAGLDTLVNLPVTLIVSGANTFTNTKNVTIAPGRSAVVVFDPVTYASNGNNTVSVRIPSDDNILNDSIAITQNVNNGTFGYVGIGVEQSTSSGATSGGQGLFSNRFFPTAPVLVQTVRVNIGVSQFNPGQQLRGVVSDSTGLVLGQSALYTITNADLGNYVNLPINYSVFPLPTFNNRPFFAGVLHISAGTQSFPVAIFNELRQRVGPRISYFNGLGATPAATTDTSSIYMIEATVVDPTLPNRISNFNLLTPANATTVNLVGNDTTTFTARWRQAVDTGGLNIGYTFLVDQLGFDFSAPVFSVSSNNGGADTAATVQYVTVDDLLDDAGFVVDSTADIGLAWTVRATAGPNNRVSVDTFEINFRRFGLNYQLCIPNSNLNANINNFIDSASITGTSVANSIRFRSGRNIPQYRNWFDTAAFQSLLMLQGQTYQFRVRMGTLPAGQGPFPHAAVALIDWNRNNRFDDANGIFSTDTLNSTSTAGALLTGNIVIPSNVSNGVYRLRIIGGDVDGTVSPCLVEFGDVEDYKLSIGVLGVTISKWEEENVEIFPNPASNYINVKFAFEQPTDVAMELYNSVGARVVAQQAKGMRHNQTVLRLDGLAKGVYTLRLNTPQGSTIRKIVLAD